MKLKGFCTCIVLIIITIWPLWVLAQPSKKIDIAPPLKIPLLLSGNFGEIRTNHLHSGLDFKTYGLPGLNVYAIDDGYISRIKIEQGGFGKAIYINHANGYTSVYGHLLSLSADIDSLCDDYHYSNNKFGVEIFTKPNKYRVKKGEFVALAGNSGGSMGPHLHFEIRETNSQMPVNIQRFFSLTITDTIPPTIFNVWIYPMDSTSFVNHLNVPQRFKVKEKYGKAILEAEQPIIVQGNISFGIETLDFMNSSMNTLGVYSIELFRNNILEFSQVIDRILFSENRSVNSLIDYGYYFSNKKRINRLYVQPNNKLPIYNNVRNGGVIAINDLSVSNIRIRLCDNNLNVSEIKFNIKGFVKDKSKALKTTVNKEVTKRIDCTTSNFFRNNQMEINFPALSVFDNFTLRYQQLPKTYGFYSNIHYVNNEDVPINKAIILKIKPKNLPLKLHHKALLCRLDNRGVIDWYGGVYADGYVSAPIRSFGKYAIVVDTVAPVIELITAFVKDKNFTDWDKIAFTVKDSQSGLSSFSGKIDGKWVLFEYDEIQDLIYYRFNLKRLKSNVMHSLSFEAIDKKGNISNYQLTFYK